MSPTAITSEALIPLLKPLVNGNVGDNKQRGFGFGTRLIHVGSDPDPVTGAVIPPISLSTTFQQAAPGLHGGFEYSRSDNPTRRGLEAQLAAAESGGGRALTFASGSAATAAILSALGPNAHVLSVDDVYGGTYRFMRRVASELHGLETTFIDFENATPAQIRASIRDNTKLVWVESPTNPMLKVADLAQLAEIVHSHPSRPLLLVDNTFLSPFFASPLRTGADIVLHSLTKYINGHSDVVMGALIFPSSPHLDAIYERAKFLQNAFGGVPSPHDAFLAQRGLKTLHLRMRAHGTSALALARFLAASPHVSSVFYPGLAPSLFSPPEQHARYARARRTLASSEAASRWLDTEHDGADNFAAKFGGVPFGGMLTFRLRVPGGDAEEADAAARFLGALRLFTLAESLGGVESLAEVPAAMTHASIPPERRAELGIAPGLVRMSVGIEETADLIEDVRQALDVALGGSSGTSSSIASSASASLPASTAATSVEDLPVGTKPE